MAASGLVLRSDLVGTRAISVLFGINGVRKLCSYCVYLQDSLEDLWLKGHFLSKIKIYLSRSI